MPILGTGIMPPAGAVASELTNVVRRAFLTNVYLQIYQSSPTICAMLSGAKVATGGVSSVTAPVQGNSMTQSQWVGYDGAFNQPSVIPGIQNAEFNLSALVTAIPFLGFEGLTQVDYAVVPLIEARMNDAIEQTINTLGETLFSITTDDKVMTGLPIAVDDGTVSTSYGGISRTTAPWWRSTYVRNPAPVTPTRNLMLQYQVQVSKRSGGKRPTFGVCNYGTWAYLAQDFTNSERYVVTPSGGFGTGSVESLFSAIDIAGLHIYPDPFVPEGTLYLLNTEYLWPFIHERANFFFTGFESLMPVMQFGYVGAMLTLIQLVNVKPRAHGKFDNLAYAPI